MSGLATRLRELENCLDDETGIRGWWTDDGTRYVVTRPPQVSQFARQPGSVYVKSTGRWYTIEPSFDGDTASVVLPREALVLLARHGLQALLAARLTGDV